MLDFCRAQSRYVFAESSSTICLSLRAELSDSAVNAETGILRLLPILIDGICWLASME